ncbi:MAG: dephospho-CoA kinase [Flavobacteriales bacterium]|nr:MAG: dephospho-CoA kinase [Flavobacteriales bacterium]
MADKPLIVGITGGIGSGKTTVAKIFEKMGIPIYIADEKSRERTATDPRIKSYIQETYGDELFDSDGSLKRKALGEIVFPDKDKLKALNEVIHPIVAEDFKEWLAQQNAPYILKEAAVLFESGTYNDCDYIIVVIAPRELRIKRVMERSGLTREEIESRMNHQWSDDDKIALSDFVIRNGEDDALMPQIFEIHEDLKRSTNSGS